MSEETKHPDPDRHWNRKWKAVVNCTAFAMAVVVAALLAALFCSDAVAENVYNVMFFAVPSFLIPLLGYFGISEWYKNNKMNQGSKQ